MALTPVEQVRLLIGATATSPFYEVLSDEEIEFIIESTDSIYEAAKVAASAMYAQLVAIPTREKTGEIEVWNDVVNGYLAFLDRFISTTTTANLKGLMPYSAGISWADITANISNPDVVKSKLTQISIEDNYNVCSDNCNLK